MRRSRPAPVAVAAFAILALGLAACGDEGGDGTGETQGVGAVRGGSVAPLAQCTDWNAGEEDAKMATIADIRAQVNQAGADGPTPDLPDDEAYDLFESVCANDYAAGFRLYKVYIRAAGFAPLAP